MVRLISLDSSNDWGTAGRVGVPSELGHGKDWRAGRESVKRKTAGDGEGGLHDLPYSLLFALSHTTFARSQGRGRLSWVN